MDYNAVVFNSLAGPIYAPPVYQFNLIVPIINSGCTITAETYTVRGKILEGENFGELMALNSLARKKLANLWVVY